MRGCVINPNTTVLNRTTVTVLVIIIAFSCNEVCPEVVNLLYASAIETAPLIRPAHQIMICCLNDILSEEFFFAKLDKNDKGNTNAALPTKIRPTNIELTATDVPGLFFTNVHLSISKASIPT
nr:Superoxide dismutase [Cu-Zn] [Ipomoea batatas]